MCKSASLFRFLVAAEGGCLLGFVGLERVAAQKRGGSAAGVIMAGGGGERRRWPPTGGTVPSGNLQCQVSCCALAPLRAWNPKSAQASGSRRRGQPVQFDRRRGDRACTLACRCRRSDIVGGRQREDGNSPQFLPALTSLRG